MNKDRINQLIREYDALVPFNVYLAAILPEHSFKADTSFKICCPLHEERTPSFSYSKDLKLWTCFGQCHTSGKTVRFHYLWLRKQYGNHIKILDTLKDLHNMFPHILPPVGMDKTSYTNAEIKNPREDLALNLQNVLERKKKGRLTQKKEVRNASLSEEFLRIFIDKNKKDEEFK